VETWNAMLASCTERGTCTELNCNNNTIQAPLHLKGINLQQPHPVEQRARLALPPFSSFFKLNDKRLLAACTGRGSSSALVPKTMKSEIPPTNP